MTMSLFHLYTSTHLPHLISNYLSKTKPKLFTLSHNKHLLLHNPLCQQKLIGQDEHQWITHRRNALVGFGVLIGGAMELGSQGMMMPIRDEFGSQPRLLKSTIRVFVPRPKRSQNKNKSKKGRPMEVLVIDGIEIKNDDPVRFDVYVSKPIGDQIGPDLGELAGSLVDLARVRVGRNSPRGSLELGIRGLVKRIGADDCEKLVVSLVPRTGEVIVEGIHIESKVA